MKNNVVFMFPVENPCLWWLPVVMTGHILPIVRDQCTMGHDDEDDNNTTPTIKKCIGIQQLPIIIIVIL